MKKLGQWALVIGAVIVYLPTVVVGIGYGASLLFDTRNLLDGEHPWWLHAWGVLGVILLLVLAGQGVRKSRRASGPQR